MLHRAVASIRDTAPIAGAVDQPEVAVFFEASSDMAPALLLRALSIAWGVSTDQIEVHNIWSEYELIDQSSAAVDTGDARLFENGYSDGPLYCDPGRTLLMVRPVMLERLLLAQAAASLLACASAARRAVMRATYRGLVTDNRPSRRLS